MFSLLAPAHGRVHLDALALPTPPLPHRNPDVGELLLSAPAVPGSPHQSGNLILLNTKTYAQ